MKRLYAILGYVLLLLVMAQAALAVWAISGMDLWVANAGGQLDASTFENLDPANPPFPEVAGLIYHGMNGMMVIPVVAVLLLVVSFLAKFRGAVGWAIAVVVLVALQVGLGLLGHDSAIAGAAHGLNAMLLFGTILLASHRASRASKAGTPVSTEAVTPAPVA